MLKYKTQSGQNIFDLAVQLYGDTSKAVQIMNDNPGLSWNTDILPQTEILYTDESNVTAQFFSTKKIVIATSNPNELIGKGFDEGFNIGFN